MSIALARNAVARLVFQPQVVGIDPETVTGVTWAVDPSPAVTFTAPDAVRGLEVGVAKVTATVQCGTNTMPYSGYIEVTAASPGAPYMAPMPISLQPVVVSPV
jgi:hypothetical protein